MKYNELYKKDHKNLIAKRERDSALKGAAIDRIQIEKKKEELRETIRE